VRTAKPSNVRDDFLTAINQMKGTYAAVDAATGPTTADEKRVAETTLLAAAAFWESFLSDLVVAYINVDASGFKAHIEKKYSAKASEKEKDEVVLRARRHVDPVMKRHLKLDEIRKVLAGNDQNVTFKSAAQLKKRAGLWLCANHKAHFHALTSAQDATLDALRSIRNFVAHRNVGARKSMNDRLAAANLPTALQRGASQVHSPGKYLRASPNGVRRLDLYLDEMVTIASLLCP